MFTILMCLVLLICTLNLICHAVFVIKISINLYSVYVPHFRCRSVGIIIEGSLN